MAKRTSDKKSGKASRVTKYDNGWSVETWYDRSHRDWVTQTKDEDGCQSGESNRAGNPAWAQQNHDEAVDALDRAVILKKGADEETKAKRVRLGHYVYRGHQIVRDDISRDWDVFIDDESPFVCSELTLKDAMAGLDRILDRKAAATAPPVESKQVRIDPAKQPRGFRHGCRHDGRDSDMPPRKFVVMGQWAWGVGETIDEATKQYRKVGGSGRRGKDFKVFLTPEFATEVSVDGMGNILWTGPNNEIVEVS